MEAAEIQSFRKCFAGVCCP